MAFQLLPGEMPRPASKLPSASAYNTGEPDPYSKKRRHYLAHLEIRWVQESLQKLPQLYSISREEERAAVDTELLHWSLALPLPLGLKASSTNQKKKKK